MDKQCSNCSIDITYGNDVYDWILKLSDHQIYPNGGVVIDIFIQPQLGKDHFFCGLGCLKKWCENEKR
jgi:hypothetical protein